MYLHAYLAPGVNQDFTLDWTQQLSPQETIISSSWTWPAGVTATLLTATTTSSTIWITSTNVGQRYSLVNTITTSTGRQLPRTLTITVRAGNPQASMWVTYDTLRREAGRFLGFSRDPSTWSDNEIQDVNDVVDAGIRLAHCPPVLPGERFAHEWSFLRPSGTLTLVAGTQDYEMPDEFAGVAGPFSLVHAEQIPFELNTVPDWQVRQMRQLYPNVSGAPYMVALVPAVTSGNFQQRYQALFYPSPDSSYTCVFRYFARQPALRCENQVPLGGVEHAELFRAAVIAAAEETLDDELGPKRAIFMERLAASVSLDRRTNSPGNLGPNLDITGECSDWWGPRWYNLPNVVVYQKYPLTPGGGGGGGGGVTPPPGGGGGTVPPGGGTIPPIDPPPGGGGTPGADENGILAEDGKVVTTEDGLYYLSFA